MEALRPSRRYRKRNAPLILCIMDGIAKGRYAEGDMLRQAYTPTLDWIQQHCPGCYLKAHGRTVGMPSDKDMGNSEVGHNVIGGGRVIPRGAALVNHAITDQSLFHGSVWHELIDNCHQHGSTLHLIGLLSDGNVHSHMDHLLALIERASQDNLRHLRVHILLDGRDVSKTSALSYIDELESVLALKNQSSYDYRIASGGGRMQITMDRYGADWAMVKRGWETHVHGMGPYFQSARTAVETLRQQATTPLIDQDLPAFVIAENSKPVGRIQDNDAVILFNFRGDRAIEISQAFENDEFDEFDRGVRPRILYAAMTEYDPERRIPHRYLVRPPHIKQTMGEYLAHMGCRQLAISETQKYGHVTYFFNGNRSGKFSESLEDYHEIRSDLVPFDQRPWMKSAEITDFVIHAIQSNIHDFIRLNYPNADMVGHTGHLQATRMAVESLDLSIARLLPIVKRHKAILLLTSDHGNADEMYERHQETGSLILEDGQPKSKTSHSLNPVPFFIYDPAASDSYQINAIKDRGISNIAATCLNLLGFEAPEVYDRSLLD